MESSRNSLLEPKVVFFWTSERQDKEDWVSCFYLKAAAVYSIITKKNQAADMPLASNLLLSIADNSASAMNAQLAAPPPVIAPGTTPPSTDQIQTQTQKLGDVLRSLPTRTMEVIDALYVVVGILHELTETSGKSPDREKLDAHFAAGRRQDDISDVIKIRNQLPLRLLTATVEHFPAALKKAAESLKPSVTTDDDLIYSIKRFSLSFEKDLFSGAVRLFCWYYSPFYSKAPPAKSADHKDVFSGKANLLECLHSTLVDASPRPAGNGSRDVTRPVALPLPTATGLVKSGLGFQPASDGKIKVRLSDSTLRIPAIVFDQKLETVVANLLAWERSRGGERPVARYLMLLRELVEEEADVKVLGGAGVLRGRVRKEGEVVGFLRRVQWLASCPLAYPAVDDEVDKVMKACGDKTGGFMERNRPTVVWASTAVLVSLLMAAIVAKRRTG